MEEEVPISDREEVRRTVAMARKRVRFRAGLCVAVVVVAAWAIGSYRPRLVYFFAGGDLVDVGDVRALRASGVETLPAQPGSYVRLRNLIVSRDEVRTKTYRYFFCPIYRVLVRTARPLPEGSVRVAQAEIPEGLEYLVEQRKVFPEDFALHFDAEGWLLPLQEVPGWKAGIRDWVRNDLKLSDQEVAASYALLDGETPTGQYWAVIVLASSLLMVLASFASLAVAVRALRRVQVAAATEPAREA